MTKQRKRTLFLVPNYTGGVGGAERVISILLLHIDKTRFECHLAQVQAEGVLFDETPEDVALHQLNVSRMRYVLPSIIRLIWAVRPHTVLATVGYLNVMLMLARPFLPRGIRLLLREATTPSAFVLKDASHPKLWTWFYRHLYRRAERVICLSDSMLEDMALNFALPREKLVRIYNPVDISKLRLLMQAQGNPYRGPGPQLVVAGRLRREKGVDVLLDAMPKVLQCFPQIRLTILGEGPQEKELREQAARLGLAECVCFLGFQENPWPFLGHADLFVLPSRMEGLPNALLEALALGTPAVATDSVGAMREIQGADVKLILVQTEDPGALADGIISALKQPRVERVSQNDLPKGLQKFDLRQVVDAYSRLF